MLEKCHEAVRLVQSNFLLFSSIVLTVWLPAGLLIGFVDPENHLMSLQVYALVSLLAPISNGALIYASSKVKTGAKTTYPAAIIAGLKNWGNLLTARFFADIIIKIGFLALIVPGVLLAIRYTLLESAVVLEGAGINTSRRRSMLLTKDMGWQLSGAIIIFSIGALVLILPIYLLQYLIEPPAVALEVISSLVLTVAFAGFAILFFVFYLEAAAKEESGGESYELSSERPPVPTYRRLAYFSVVLIVVMLHFLPALRSTFSDWNDVPTGAMKPSILEGDRIIVNRLAYDLKVPFTRLRLTEWGSPTRGDIVLFRSPEDGKLLVKRVVGLPDETIELRGGRLFIDEVPATYTQALPEATEWIAENDRSSYFFATESMNGRRYPIMITIDVPVMAYGPSKIPESHYFVLGDNRSNSRDSRWFGSIERNAILGRATAVALSADPDDFYLPRWKRFFTSLH